MFDQVLQDFLADLRLAGRSERTVGGHELELKRLARWLDEQGLAWDRVTSAQLRQYARLRAGRGHSSRSNMMCSLRVFYGWAVEQEMIGKSPAVVFKTPIKPRPAPKPLTQEQIQQLLAALASADGRKARRDEALLITSLYAGLRAKELAELDWSQVDLRAESIRIIMSKWNHGRTVHLHGQLSEVLARWREQQGHAGQGRVFSLNRKAFNGNRVGKIARYWARKIGIHFTAHMLRHSFATYALRHSHDLYGVSKALGHSELRQTEIYVAADPEYNRHAVSALPSLNGW